MHTYIGRYFAYGLPTGSTRRNPLVRLCFPRNKLIDVVCITQKVKIKPGLVEAYPQVVAWYLKVLSILIQLLSKPNSIKTSNNQFEISPKRAYTKIPNINYYHFNYYIGGVQRQGIYCMRYHLTALPAPTRFTSTKINNMFNSYKPDSVNHIFGHLITGS